MGTLNFCCAGRTRSADNLGSDRSAGKLSLYFSNGLKDLGSKLTAHFLSSRSSNICQCAHQALPNAMIDSLAATELAVPCACHSSEQCATHPCIANQGGDHAGQDREQPPPHFYTFEQAIDHQPRIARRIARKYGIDPDLWSQRARSFVL